VRRLGASVSYRVERESEPTASEVQPTHTGLDIHAKAPLSPYATGLARVAPARREIMLRLVQGSKFSTFRPHVNTTCFDPVIMLVVSVLSGKLATTSPVAFLQDRHTDAACFANYAPSLVVLCVSRKAALKCLEVKLGRFSYDASWGRVSGGLALLQHRPAKASAASALLRLPSCLLWPAPASDPLCSA